MIKNCTCIKLGRRVVTGIFVTVVQKTHKNLK